MNAKSKSKPTRKAIWLRWPFLVTVIPLGLLFLCVTALAGHEKQAFNRVQAELARLRASGQPIDDASMSEWFLDNTSSEGAAAWGAIIQLVTAAPRGTDSFDRLPYVGRVGRASVPAEIKPGSDWPEQREVAEYLRCMRPVIDQIAAATEYPTPVWQPLEFRGFMTLLGELQNSRQLTRLLALEAEHALYHGDTDRALRSLESMRGVAAAFDWELCIVAELVQIAARGVHQNMIRRSLAADLWSADQLQLLQEQLGPARDVPPRWRRVIAGERALILASVSDREFWQAEVGLSPLWSMPSLRAAMLRNYQEMENVAAGGLVGLVQRAGELERHRANKAGRRQSFLSFIDHSASYLPAIGAFAEATESEENSRRFSRTAVAIKAFQLRSGRWPHQLAELQQVGLSADDWNTVSGGRFGYESGEAAYLWGYPYNRETRTRVPATRPEPNEDESGSDTAMVIIR